MAKGVFLALSNPTSGDVEDEFNQWYDDVHSKEVLALPGVRSCRRFRLAPAQVMPGDEDSRRYLALYEVDTDDWGAFAAEFQQAFGDGRITIRPELHRARPVGPDAGLRGARARGVTQGWRVLSITATIRTGSSPRLRHAWRVPRCTTQSPGWSVTSPVSSSSAMSPSRTIT